MNRTINNSLLFPLLLLAACAGNYKHPSISNPQSMSADTLCYRYGTNPQSQELAAEIESRGIDCSAILKDEPLYTGRPEETERGLLPR